MTAAGLIGFGLVFWLVCWLASLLLTAATVALAPRAPAVERRASSLAASLPPLFAILIVAILIVESLLGEDHCAAHGHHAHLCLVHGIAWADRIWVIGFVSVATVAALAKGIALALSIRRGARLVARLEKTSSPDADCSLVESERAFCFVAGTRRPRIYVSRAARAALLDEEWEAMLAHERGHIEHRDLSRRLALELSLLLAAPFTSGALRRRWDAATERLRDADAAERSTPEVVASALVCMARASFEGRSVGLAAFSTTSPELLTERVTSLLDHAPRGEREARSMGIIALLGAGALIGLALALAHPLHHVLETLLG